MYCPIRIYDSLCLYNLRVFRSDKFHTTSQVVVVVVCPRTILTSKGPGESGRLSHRHKIVLGVYETHV